jgi:deoxyribodipyrimidine photo-lyase
MIAARRATWNFALQRATEWATELGKPLIVLGGRNPNSYSGIFWCLGQYDRPWGPARPIFGTIRYMSSVNTARKVRVMDFIRRYPL